MIYDNIKALSDKRKLSIMEVERKAGLSNGTIGKWRTSEPVIKNLKLVADVLGVSVNRLLKD